VVRLTLAPVVRQDGFRQSGIASLMSRRPSEQARASATLPGRSTDSWIPSRPQYVAL